MNKAPRLTDEDILKIDDALSTDDVLLSMPVGDKEVIYCVSKYLQVQLDAAHEYYQKEIEKIQTYWWNKHFNDVMAAKKSGWDESRQDTIREIKEWGDSECPHYRKALGNLFPSSLRPRKWCEQCWQSLGEE